MLQGALHESMHIDWKAICRTINIEEFKNFKKTMRYVLFAPRFEAEVKQILAFTSLYELEDFITAKNKLINASYVSISLSGQDNSYERLRKKDFHNKQKIAQDFINQLLLIAAESGCCHIVSYLIDHGAKINTRICDYTPLRHATKYNDVEMVTLLLSKNADPSIQFRDTTSTVLHLAANEGYSHIIRLLLDAGADVNSITPYGATPLHLAVYREKLEAVQTLLEYGADVNIKASGIADLSPLQIAHRDGLTDIIALLEQHAQK